MLLKERDNKQKYPLCPAKAFVHKLLRLINVLLGVVVILLAPFVGLEHLISPGRMERLLASMPIPISRDLMLGICWGYTLFAVVFYFVWTTAKRSPKYGYHYIEGFEVNCWSLRKKDVSYPLNKLVSFFSLDTGDSNQYYSLKDIHKEFPIMHLRTDGASNYYIAYNVCEGGKFLVFLALTCSSDGGWKPCYVRNMPNTMHIRNLPSEQDFHRLITGNTYADVKKIAPCTQLIDASGNVESYSLLENKSVVLCTYSKQEDGTLRLETTEVLSKKDRRNPFSSIVPADLKE